MTFAARRWLSLSILIVFSLLALAVDRAYSSTLLRSQFLSGSVLLAAIVFLAVYNVRKKLPFLPLGSSSVWLQVHLNVGWFSILLFLLHVGFRAPNGPLETTLALLYLGAAASGVFGLRISRRFAPRLARHGEEVIFERIPELRRRLREEAEALVVPIRRGREVDDDRGLLRRPALAFLRRPAQLLVAPLAVERPSPRSFGG